jgi:hypothetical protein
MDRGAEVAVQDLAEPDHELLRQRQIESHLVAFGFDLGDRRHGRQRHGSRVDRQQPQNAKQQRRDKEQDHHRDQGAANDQQQDRVHAPALPPLCDRAETFGLIVLSPWLTMDDASVGSPHPWSRRSRLRERTSPPTAASERQAQSMLLASTQPLPYLT